MHPRRRAGKTLIRSPRMMGNHVLCGSNDGRLVALDKTGGRLIWEHDFSAAVCSSPSVNGGRIFLAVRDGKLYFIDAARPPTP